MKAIVIAAPHSGCGKTLLTLGVLEALKRRSLRLAPFKVGPDFIDPGYHRLITGTPSLNLDGWMCPPSFVRETYFHHARGADVAVIEGVMGLYDGIDGRSDEGSTAQVAKLVGAPVVLVVDARSQARSAAALVHGFASFDSDVRVAGVILNNVASENHERMLREALKAHCPQVAVVGCVPRDATLALPSRHLGLVTVEDNPLSPEFLDRLSQVMERHLDLDLLLGIGEDAGASDEVSGNSTEIADEMDVAIDHPFIVASPPAAASPPLQGEGQGGDGFHGQTVKIAVARDAAFCFVYEDNLRLLRSFGAELCDFSPLAHSSLPQDISGIYLPGGYPELFARQLSQNDGMLQAIRAAVEGGVPLYAECGGFMYLTRGLIGGADSSCAENPPGGEGPTPFAAVYPVHTRMLPRRKALGYREVQLVRDGVIGPSGTRARGHEFHYSETEEMPPEVERIYAVSRKGVPLGREGYIYKNCLASYVHLHFGSCPEAARSFVEQCRAYRKRSRT